VKIGRRGFLGATSKTADLSAGGKKQALAARSELR
jgi:hypothetical protein